ncbi:hypothetical protein [Roseomonas haemaphysalidis]|uniref:SHOCT domain-containing protein n=1 Tax=Roseomonas haemaphysalidis TaxID=2768162 RepID=A0ABS3KME1_9PROT|nr:hypothetical protein [Roseomonas haemaphysalidis]MBO1078612.1 SHOCT domain-containing protein [Roseomonas haemaphysalidis]
MRRLLAASLLCLGLAACGTTQVSMPYSATATPVAVGRPVVTVAAVTDRREDGREDANWIGTIRGGFGNPIKRLEADRPVTEVVRAAFTDGLAARGMLAQGTGRYALSVEVLQFKSDQLSRREATVEFRVSLAPATGGPPVLVVQERANQVGGSAITLTAGVFGSLDDLRAIALSTMNEAVDRVLNRPDFAAALR